MVLGNTSEVQVLDVGCDWLTVTSDREHAEHDLTLASWYEVFNRIRHTNGLVKDGHFLGYQGIATDGAFVGTRYDGAMLRLSGPVARDNFLSVVMRGASPTRLDVQVTCSWKGTGMHPPRLAALHAGTANELLPISRQRNIEERKDNRGGFTTYIGSRQSAAFARVYHKSAQDPDAYGPDVYRYEVQFNKEGAMPVWEALRKYADNLESAAIAIVWDWFEKRGIIPVFRRSAEKINVSRETIAPTEIDKKLHWLNQQVSPTVHTLVDAGYREEALIAVLGSDLGREVTYFLRTQLMQRIDGLVDQRVQSRDET